MSVLYETDFLAWTAEQADALRRRSANEIDWDNLLEEVDALAASLRRELTNRLTVLIAHRLEWTAQPNLRNRSWILAMDEQQDALRDMLEQSPSLRPYLAEAWSKAYPRAIRLACKETGFSAKRFPQEPPFDFEQLLREPALSAEA